MQMHDEVAHALAREQVPAPALCERIDDREPAQTDVLVFGSRHAEVVRCSHRRTRCAVAEKFLRAYQRAAADYAAMVQLDRSATHVYDRHARDRHDHSRATPIPDGRLTGTGGSILRNSRGKSNRTAHRS